MLCIDLVCCSFVNSIMWMMINIHILWLIWYVHCETFYRVFIKETSISRHCNCCYHLMDCQSIIHWMRTMFMLFSIMFSMGCVRNTPSRYNKSYCCRLMSGLSVITTVYWRLFRFGIAPFSILNFICKSLGNYIDFEHQSCTPLAILKNYKMKISTFEPLAFPAQEIFFRTTKDR